MFSVAQIADAVIEAPISVPLLGPLWSRGDEDMRIWSLTVLLAVVVGVLVLRGPSVVFAFTGANLGGLNLTGANLAGHNLAGSNLAGHNLAGHNLRGRNLAGTNLNARNGVQVNVDGFAKSTGFVLDGFKVVNGRLIVGQ